MRCKILPDRLDSLNRFKDRLNDETLSSEENSRQRKLYDRLSEKRHNDQKVCTGFVNSEQLEPWRYLFNAALAGHVPSMSQFATMPLISELNSVRNLEVLAAYSQYASIFLVTAANAGDRSAVWSLAEAYAGDSLFLNGGFGFDRLIEPDPYMATVFSYASLRLPAEQSEINMQRRLLRKLEQKLSPQQMQSAKLTSDAMVARWGIKPPRAPDSISRGYDEFCDQ